MRRSDDDPAEANPLRDIDATQMRRRWVSYALVIFALCGLLLVLEFGTGRR